MQRKNNTLLWYLLLLCIALLFGCEPQPVSESVAREALDQVVREEIPLSDERLDATADTRKNFYFILDGSGSMGEGQCIDSRFRNKLEGAKWAVREFAKSIPSGVNVGLYVFDNNRTDEILPLHQFNDPEVFLGAVDSIEHGGGTPLAQAIRVGTDSLVEQCKTQLGYGEFRLVVVTDGQADELDRASLYAAQFGIPIYAIGFCIGEDHPLRRYAVSYRSATSPEDLARGLEETLAEAEYFDQSTFAPSVATE